MFRIKKINNVSVEPLEKPKKRKKPSKSVLGWEYFQDPFCNIFIVAKKKSGKTTLIYNILKNILSSENEQKVFFFVSTMDNDIIYEKIFQLLKYNGIFYEKYNSLIDDEDGTNNLLKVIKNLDPVDKSNNTYPENIFIFDDLSSELKKATIINTLIKQNRHYKAKTIFSSQYITDLDPAARLNIDYCLVFKGLTEENLRRLYDSLELWTDSFEEFKKIYDAVVYSGKYTFLYIDRQNEEFRINFDKVLEKTK